MVSCVFSKQGARGINSRAYQRLVLRILLRLEHQLNLAHRNLLWVQIGVCFVLIDAYAFWQIEKPTCLGLIPFLHAVVVRWPREGLTHERTAEGHEGWFIRQTLRLRSGLACS